MPTTLPDTGNIKAAVIVGGHGYDVPGFKALFDSLGGVDWYLQDIDNWVGSPVADQYDVFVFYHMVAWGIWSLRADMKEHIDAANRRIGATEQGWFVWHHALLSFPDSPAFDRVCNSTDRTLKKPGRFTPRIDMNVRVEHPDHPVTAGVGDFAISGEGFALPACGPQSTVLLTHDHAGNIPSLAWCSSTARACCAGSRATTPPNGPTPASSKSSSRASNGWPAADRVRHDRLPRGWQRGN